MLAGGIGEVKDRNSIKNPIEAGDLVVVLGGPSMLIGLGGGAADSYAGITTGFYPASKLLMHAR